MLRTLNDSSKTANIKPVSRTDPLPVVFTCRTTNLLWRMFVQRIYSRPYSETFLSIRLALTWKAVVVDIG